MMTCSLMRNVPSINFFKQNNILKFIIRLNLHGLKLLMRLRFGLSHLRGHKLKQNFSDCLDETCKSGKYIESTKNFLLHCSLFRKERQVSMNKICDIDSSLIDQNENSLCYTLLFGKEIMSDNEKSHILNTTIEYILLTERFNVSLFK